MAITLPLSLRKERHPARQEVQWARALTPEQRLAVVATLCRDVAVLLQMNDKRDRLLALRDPVPESTRRALARLRTR